jgi:cytochrome b561
MPTTVSGYSFVARFLHWTMAFLVLVMLVVGFAMVQQGLPKPLQGALYILHKNTGILILALVVLRFVWRKIDPPPPLPDSAPRWQQAIADFNHGALYLLLFLMPILGYVRVKAADLPIESLDAMGMQSLVPASEPLAKLASTLHLAGALALAALVALHLLAAFYHGAIRRDGVYSRMRRGRHGRPDQARRAPTALSSSPQSAPGA